MKKLELVDMDKATELMDRELSTFDFGTEQVPLRKALGRKMAETLYAGFPVPGFNRSAVDGYAVKLGDFNSGVATLLLEGYVEMGMPYDSPLKQGACVYVPTGGMVPDGTEAMVMQEYAVYKETEPMVISSETEADEEGMNAEREEGILQVELTYQPSPLEHIVAADEDFKLGEPLVKTGTFLKAAQLGKLSAAGFSTVKVQKRPRVVVLSTGNELTDLGANGQKPEMGKVYDINGMTIGSLAQGMGFEVVGSAWCNDDEETLYGAIRNALDESDMVILSGGSSVGEKDVTSRAISRFEKSQILFHGIRVKPGKPTLLAQIHMEHAPGHLAKKLILGLPGHPASAFMIMTCFGGYLAESVWALKPSERQIAAVLKEDLQAPAERDQLVLVTLEEAKGEDGAHLLKAKPIFGKSAVISRIADADGYVIHRVSEGTLPAGTWVHVKPMI